MRLNLIPALGLALAAFISGPVLAGDAMTAGESAKAVAEPAFPAANLDTNNDGTADAWDTNGDGKAEYADANGDGKPDAASDVPSTAEGAAENGAAMPPPAAPGESKPEE